MKQYAFAFFRLTALLLFACGFAGEVRAQEMNDVSFQLKIYNKFNNKEFTEVCYCRLFSSVDKAQELERKIKRNLMTTQLDYDETKVKVLDNIVKNDFKKKRTNGQGMITYPVVTPGMAVLFMTTDYTKTRLMKVVAGTTAYSDTVHVMRLDDVKGKGNLKKMRYDEVSVIDYGDGNETFEISTYLPEGLAKDDSRLIFQIYAVDCVTEDTVDYLPPVVYEGADYHVLQNKRKNYDYDKYDPLALGYDDSDTLRGGKEKTIKTVIQWPKPDKKKKYRGPFSASLEDYHHCYWRKDNDGTCLRVMPFKFLDFSVAEAPLKLGQEFYEEPDQGVDSVAQNLELEFQLGKAILKEDTSYARKLSDLAIELNNVDDLLGADLDVYSSPEGGPSNERLSLQRAQAAANLIRMPRGKRVVGIPHVYTWEQTADELDKRKQHETAQAIRDALASAGSDWRARDHAVKKVPLYDSIVVPEMERERKMTFTYRSLREHVKEDYEALAAFEENPKRVLSWGDYYNVYKLLIARFENKHALSDSLKLAELTRITYDRIAKQVDPLAIPLAPYVINQMALVRNRIAPDTTIYNQFSHKLINDTLPMNFDVPLSSETSLRVNRPEFVLNQAVAYFKLQELKKAKHMLQMVKTISSDDEDLQEAIQKLEHFINFREQLPNKKRTPEQDTLFQRALHFIEASGPNNRAILYTELPEQLEKQNEAELWVDLMSDDLPEKWYLKGILWASKTDTQKELDDDDTIDALIEQAKIDAKGEKLAPTGVELSINKMGHFLGYFQHAFDLEQKLGKNDMLRYYFNEGHVKEQIRKKYPYKKALIPVYRKIFEQRSQIDDDGLEMSIEKLAAMGYDMEEYEQRLEEKLKTLRTATESGNSADEEEVKEALRNQAAAAEKSEETF